MPPEAERNPPPHGDHRWLHADVRGSIIAVTGSIGAPITGSINVYDEYGIPGATKILKASRHTRMTAFAQCLGSQRKNLMRTSSLMFL